MLDTPDHFLLICSTCKGEDNADALCQALAAKLPSGFALRKIACMAGCAHPTTVGFQASGKAQYLFGDIETEQDIKALVEFAGQFRLSEDGWTSATDRPPQLFEKTLSRLPRLEVGECR
ncbi:DUF1636 family protein [Ruegeria atlantica]|uniref:DUF1636 family protein n=1 Tax=Ruegeria atlantica TaxID=81569 RepID=UPI00147CE1AC|nr:DUF1636 domain-containing protein [Ruegeria atlantica]